MQASTTLPAASSVDPQTVNIVFFVLFVCYFIQLVLVSRMVRAGWRQTSTVAQQSSTSNQQRPIRLWRFLGLSLVGPTLLGFLPDLDFDNPSGISMILHVGVRFIIAYLITIVTLELTWLAQDERTEDNPWQGLLAINLLFDVISALIFYKYKYPLDHMQAGIAVKSFFLMCAIATVMTGTVVISGAYSLLSGD